MDTENKIGKPSASGTCRAGPTDTGPTTSGRPGAEGPSRRDRPAPASPRAGDDSLASRAGGSSSPSRRKCQAAPADRRNRGAFTPGKPVASPRSIAGRTGRTGCPACRGPVGSRAGRFVGQAVQPVAVRSDRAGRAESGGHPDAGRRDGPAGRPARDRLDSVSYFGPAPASVRRPATRARAGGPRQLSIRHPSPVVVPVIRDLAHGMPIARQAGAIERPFGAMVNTVVPRSAAPDGPSTPPDGPAAIVTWPPVGKVGG